MNKKQMTMLAIGVLAVVAIYWFFFRKKDTKKESSFNPDYLVIGDEMGYKGAETITRLANGATMRTNPAKCTCTGGSETGFCVTPPRKLSYCTNSIYVPTPKDADTAGRMIGGMQSNNGCPSGFEICRKCAQAPDGTKRDACLPKSEMR
jgi:hypothetical protein